jgi:hypothetical protein
MDGLVRNPGPDVTGTAFESGGERGGSVLGYSQANSSQPNTVHEYIHISEVRLYAELSMI